MRWASVCHLQTCMASANAQLEAKGIRQHPDACNAAARLAGRVAILRALLIARLAPWCAVDGCARHASRAAATVFFLKLGVHATTLPNDLPILPHNVAQAVIVARAVEHAVRQDGSLVVAPISRC